MRKQLGKIKLKNLVSKQRRRLSIRLKVNGTSDRPRVCVVKSNKHLSVQVIDDVASKTLFAVQSYGKNAPEGADKTVEGAKVIGATVASKLKESNIECVVFDRAGYKYTGSVAALVEAIRENGVRV